jgi:Na+-driven multidrug efflux pump
MRSMPQYLGSNMITYMRAHWRGAHPVGWAFLVNGVGAYICAIALAMLLDRLTEKHGNYLFWKCWPAVSMLLVFWSWMGIARAIVRTLEDRKASFVSKVGSVGILLLFLAGVLVVASNLSILPR